MIKKAINSLKKIIQAESFKGAVSLVSSGGASIVVGLGLSYFLVRMLSPENYGYYYYVISVLTLACTLSTFGFIYSECRLLLLCQNKDEQQKVFGASIVITIANYIFVCAALYIIYTIIPGIAKNDTEDLLLWSIPGIIGLLMLNRFEVLLPASGQIKVLIKSRLYPKFTYLLFVGSLYVSVGYEEYSVKALLLSNFAATVIWSMYLIKDIKPAFNEVKEGVKIIISENKKYGLNMYFGSIFSVGGASLVGVLIGAMSSNKAEVAYYFLALSICSPLSIVSSSLSAVFLRRFITDAKLSGKVITSVVLALSLATAAILSIADEIVSILWGEQYSAVLVYIYVLVGSFYLYGIGDFINKYLGAHGKGKELRDSSFIVGISLIAATVYLVNYYDGIGAAYARFISGVVYMLTMIYYYKSSRIDKNA